MTFRPSSSLFFGFLLAGCAPAGPDAWGEYHGAVTSLLAENHSLEKHFEAIAIKVKKKDGSSPDATAVDKRLEEVAIPAAKSLSERASAIELRDPALAPIHQLLVDAWATRSSAWVGIDAAWDAKDLTAMETALEQSSQSRLLEDRWFDETSKALREHGYVLERFPTPPAGG